MLDALVVIVNGYRQHLLGVGLANYVFVENPVDFLGDREIASSVSRLGFFLDFLTNDVVTKFDTFITDEH